MPPPGPVELLPTIVLFLIVRAPATMEMPPPPREPAELSVKVHPEIEPIPPLESDTAPAVVLAKLPVKRQSNRYMRAGPAPAEPEL